MPRGRPRTFDTEEALDSALRLFWRHGYEGTSISTLSSAMRINIPSLYAAFGNKEALFRKVVERYLQRHAIYIRHALAEPTARQAAEKLFKGAIDMVCEHGNPPGCLVVQGALVSDPMIDAIRLELAERRAQAESLIRGRFERALQEGDLPPGTDVAKLARFIITVNWGNAVQSASGACREQLEAVTDMAMRCWPV